MLVSDDARQAIKHFLSGTSVLDLLELRPIFESVLALESEGVPFSVAALSSRLELRLQSVLTELSFAESALQEEDATQQALHCLRALEEKGAAAKERDLKRRVRELETNGKIQEAFALMEELQRAKSSASGS